jgi:LPS O-antigen subunit length determinant protein (WzzB/FepE family)
LALKIEKSDAELFNDRRLAQLHPLGEVSENLYALLVIENWRLIAIVTFVAVVATYFLTKFAMTKWYQATAIIEPIPEGAVENRVEGGMGGLGGAGMSTFLMITGIDSQAQEYLTILRSFTFNTEVATRHHLTDELMRDVEPKPKTQRKMELRLYEVLKARFKVDYSMQAHNLSVHFLDRDPVRAEQILQFYLDDLRELQRQEAITDARAAIDSLEKEARGSADSLLNESLYALVARQLQRQKLAEVEADFAFKILEPPISPERPYTPRASINCLIVLMFMPVLMTLAIVGRQLWRNERARIATPPVRRRPVATDHDLSF